MVKFKADVVEGFDVFEEFRNSLNPKYRHAFPDPAICADSSVTCLAPKVLLTLNAQKKETFGQSAAKADARITAGGKAPGRAACGLRPTRKVVCVSSGIGYMAGLAGVIVTRMTRDGCE